MDDMVKRLRSSATIFYEYAADDGALLRAAADRIEALEEEVRTQRVFAVAGHEAATERIEELEREKRWIIDGRDRDFAAVLARLNTARREALEEAARVADEREAHWRAEYEGGPHRGNSHVEGLMDGSADLATRIRALKERE